MSGETLTAEMEADLRRLHQPRELHASTKDPKPVWCSICGSFDQPWPCSTARLLATLDRDRAVLAALAAALTEALNAIDGDVINLGKPERWAELQSLAALTTPVPADDRDGGE